MKLETYDRICSIIDNKVEWNRINRLVDEEQSNKLREELIKFISEILHDEAPYYKVGRYYNISFDCGILSHLDWEIFVYCRGKGRNRVNILYDSYELVIESS